MTLHEAVENPHAGKGSSVLLDIGGDIGAIVIDMPAELIDREVERRVLDHDPHAHAPHVGVVRRSAPDGMIIPSAVFYEVPSGRYRLRLLPDGDPLLEVDVEGGRVTHASWPTGFDR